MARITVAGHPLHGIINDWPIGLLSTSFVLDALSTATDRDDLATAGHYTFIAGYLTSIAAAVTGIAEYSAIEKTGDVKRLADRHAALNSGIFVLNTALLALRLRNGRRLSPAALLLSGVANGLMILSAWYGYEMVYNHGVRVRDEKIKADDQNVRLPFDEQLSGLLRAGTTPSPEPRTEV